jgi:hypothetical protein
MPSPGKKEGEESGQITILEVDRQPVDVYLIRRKGGRMTGHESENHLEQERRSAS